MSFTRAGKPALLLALCLGLPWMASCERRPPVDAWTTSTDTLPGGAVVVVNTPIDNAPQPRWRFDEELRIGAVEAAGPTAFGEIKALTVLDDGRIAVLESQTQEIRIFNPDGRPAATWGGKGGGPGEFRNALGMMRTSKGLLYIPDQGNARMTVLHPDSGFVRSYPIKLYSWGFVWGGAIRGDDYIIVPSLDLELGRDAIRIYSPEMAETDTVLLPPRPEVEQRDPPGSFAWQAPGGMPRGFALVPFYAQPQTLLDARGNLWSTSAGDIRYRISYATLRGDTSLIIETRRPPIPVSAVERDSALRAVVERLSSFGVRTLDASKIPPSKPAVLALFEDDRGRLWVQTSSRDSLTRYDVYERDGSFAGELAVPWQPVRWVRPAVRGDAFYAVVTDELDVPYVVRGRLVPTTH